VDVVLVEPQPTPLAAVLGEQIGELVARLHRANGVDVRSGIGVAEVRGEGHVETVVLADGAELAADLVVLGVGSRPATGWLDGCGVDLYGRDSGVLCDLTGRTSAPNVWAVGDVAFWRGRGGHEARVEHWSNVVTQVRVMVPAMLGRESLHDVAVPPYFWSDRTTSKSSAWASRGPPTPCIWSKTTATSSWRTTSATAWWSGSSAPAGPAK
jgi:NADPH-dependent 2,4-dienoyl-CoA reductase/sulfur reductase-like enzyme